MPLTVKRTKKGELMRQTMLSFQELSGIMDDVASALVAQHGETLARYKVLTAAGCERFTVPQIARRMGMSRQGVQRTVRELHNDGLVVLVPNPDHRRSPHVELTERGRAVDDAISSDFAADNNARGRALSLGDLQQALGALRQLTEAFEA